MRGDFIAEIVSLIHSGFPNVHNNVNSAKTDSVFLRESTCVCLCGRFFPMQSHHDDDLQFQKKIHTHTCAGKEGVFVYVHNNLIRLCVRNCALGCTLVFVRMLVPLKGKAPTET